MAIVGSSGSGKSTIASLLLGLYPAAIDQDSLIPSGTPSITLFGHNIRSLHLPTPRSMISIVPQTPSLPRGYETVIGDGRLGLSGGQVQWIVIARALCRRPNILILDEATSASDGESAWVIRKSVSELVREESGMTVVIITHSRDMMQCADYVVVLEQGRVAEEGGFRELVARKGKL
jgi:ATP-binding cassette, subfamily B (MDR/TAP), member 1